MTNNNITQETVDNALLSKVAYDDQKGAVDLTGYTRLGSSNELLGYSITSGYYGVAYQNDITQEIYISHSGTNELVDWTDSNSTFLTGGVPAQYSDASNFTSSLLSQYNSDNQTNLDFTDLNHTGHSLGGALATLMGVSTNANQVYAYNAPGVGGNGLIYLEIHNQVPLGTYTNADFSNIFAYAITEDIISDIGNQIGNYETLDYTVLDILSIFANAINPFASGSDYLNTIAFAVEMSAYLQAHSIEKLHALLENELNNTAIVDETIGDFLQSFANEFNTTLEKAEEALTAVLSESLKSSYSQYNFVDGFALDDLVASYTDPQGNTLTTQQFLALTQNQTFANSSITYQYQDYNNGSGQIIIVEKPGSKVYFPADNDAEYSIQINHLDPANDVVEGNAYENYWGDLLVDISGSAKTAGVALSEVPLKPEYLPEKATVIDGTNEQNFSGYALDEEAAIGELKGGAHYSGGAVIRENSGSFSYVPEGDTTDIDGQSYLITDVLDSLEKAAEASSKFIVGVGENLFEHLSQGDGLKTSFVQFVDVFQYQIGAGTLEFEDALEEFAKLYANNVLQLSITEELTEGESKDLIAQVLKEGFGVEGEEAVALTDTISVSIAQMIGTFATQSSGWNSEDYAKAGTAIIANAVITHVIKDYLAIENDALDGVFRIGGSAITALINSGEITNEQWEDIGIELGIEAAAYFLELKYGLDIPAINFNAMLDGNALEVAVNVAIEGLSYIAGPFAPLVKLGLRMLQSEFYTGKKFYEGEFGDKGALLNSIYQVQQIDDGSGNMVDALVATSAEGSTILMQSLGQFDYAVGGAGSDILVGDDTGDIMSGGAGNDYIEGKEGDEQISGDAGNDHLIGAEGDDVIQGGDGDDIIFGDAGEDTILGGDGQDFIHGGSGADAILGGLERDTILASGGDDVVQGDAGDDMIDGGYGDDLLDGGDGNDLLLGNLGNDSITAGAGDDKLFGDVGNDTMMGDAGNDYINGGEGVDILQGGNGSDLIYGDSGDDYLQGDLGNDDLGGGTGNDVILGGLDNDYLWGQEGDDDLDSGEGDDIVVGGLGEDSLAGEAGNDVYILEADDSGLFGNDVITDSEGVNDRVYINGLDGTNEANLGLTRDGDNLLISFNAVTIATIAGHFAAGADSVERIEFDTDKFIDLANVTYDGTTGVGTFASSIDTNQTTKADIDLREAAIDSNIQQQSQYWNNAFLQNLSETAYEEALRDQFETEYYNGSEVTEFKRSRGKFGGHYKVYRLEQSDTLDGTPQLYKYEELEAGYNPADYLEIENGEKYEYYQLYGNYGLPQNYEAYLEHYYIGGEFSGLHYTSYDPNGNIYSEVQSAAGDGNVLWEVNAGNGWGASTLGFMLTYGTMSNIELGKTEISGSDHLVGSWWNETIDGNSGDDALFGGDGDDTLNGDLGDDWLFGGDGTDTVNGGTGSDSIFGGGGDDNLNGGDGADAILAGDGDDIIDGGSGDDWIEAGDGDDTIYGGDGDDIIYGGSGEDTANGGDGTDFLYGQGGNDTLYGDSGSDYLYGGLDNDKLYGNGGDDGLYGEEGDDFLYGGADADVIDGGDGNDTLSYKYSTSGVTISLLAATASGGYAVGDTFTNVERLWGSDFDDDLTGDDQKNYITGGLGADIINGLGGDDILYGNLLGSTIDGGAGDLDFLSYYTIDESITIDATAGTATSANIGTDTFVNVERFFGGQANDTLTASVAGNFLYGYLGDDTLNGNVGDDRLYGGDGSDTLNGNDGNDMLYGEGGNDYVYGNDGDDIIYGGLGNDVIDGGAGNDTITYYNISSDVTIDLANNIASSSGSGLDSIFNIEQAVGGMGNDTIYGSSAANNLDGFEGDDLIRGREGDDQLFGHAGDDLIYGDEGDDVIDGGTGVDTISYYGLTTGVTIDMQAGTVTGTQSGNDSFSNIEIVQGTNRDDNYTNNTSTSFYFYAYGGDDIITGGTGADYIYGNYGADNINGGDGNDLIHGEQNGDIINGGNGEDTASYLTSDAAVNINLTTDTYSGGHADGDTLISIEKIVGSVYADEIRGDANNNVVWANNDNDYVVGYDGNDSLHGGHGNDNLHGNDGDDTLNGNTGNDLLTGGAGSDTLDGGDGVDRAYYTASDAAVTINLETNTASGGHATGDTLISIEEVYGSTHNDTLTGDSENNTIWGHTGDDTIDGRDGQDTFYGGAGNDIFVFSNLTHSTNTSQDTIKDFEQGNDLIDLTAFTFTSISDFTVSQVSGDTIIDDNSSTFSFAMDGTYTLTDNDFIFV